MGKILSQEEIDALLGSASAALPADTGAQTSAKSYITYNFRRPDRVSKEQIRSLHFLHDRFGRNVSTSLSAYLRAVTDVSIVSVEQFAYSEFLMSLADPTAFYAVSMAPFEGLAALELSNSVAFTMIDRMLGGRGATPGLSRGLTEIEQNVVDAVVRLVLENLTELWKPIGGISFRIHARETRPQMLQLSAPNEIFILLVFDIRVADARGMVNLALPASIIEMVGHNFSQGWHRTRREQSTADRARLLANLATVPLSLSVLAESRMRTGDVLGLRPGDVIQLDREIARPLDVQIEGASKFAGRLVRLAHSAGLRVEQQSLPALEENAA